MNDEEFNALQRHLFGLRRKAVDGDKSAIDDMFFWIDSLLIEKKTKMKADLSKRQSSGAKKGKWQKRAIILQAMAMRRELIEDLGQAEWSLLVDEVCLKVEKNHGIKLKKAVAKDKETKKVISESVFISEDGDLVKIKDRSTVKKILHENRKYIEGIKKPKNLG